METNTANRRVVWLHVCASAVLKMLQEKGSLSELRLGHDNLTVTLPDDAKLVGVELRRPLRLGDSEIVFAIESDSLPDECLYDRGGLFVTPSWK